MVAKVLSGKYPIDTDEMGNWQLMGVNDLLNEPNLADFCKEQLKEWAEREDVPFTVVDLK